MIPSAASFADELEKLGGLTGGLARMGGGALKKTLGLAAKHPMKALGVGMIAVPTLMAYNSGRDSGQNEGEKPQFLSATRDRPSEAAYTNYHNPIEHAPTPRETRALSKNYKPGMFHHVSSTPKEK